MRKSGQKMMLAIVLTMVMLVGCSTGGESGVFGSGEVGYDAVGTAAVGKENEDGPEGSGSPYFIKVDRTANCVTIYERGADGSYANAVKYMVCSVGTDGNTPIGVFAISDQYRWRALFGGTYGQYASRITGNILFHSVPYLKEAGNSLAPGAYNQLGTKASQGCVRLTCGDAKWIYDHCPAGTVVEIFDGPTETVPEKPPSLFLDPESPYRGWDPTDPSADNPWKSLPISIHRVEDLKVERGSDVDLLKNVFALDVDGKTLLEVQVSGTVDLNRCGTYIVAYSAVGATGAEKTVYATVTVVESEDGEVS
ncbi:MAG: L,D-transpeptidase family protein [Lachnospiraceae bacterium]|nr:L,D-transpeptidase family protein [Lachnospiraceae bacterium]